VQGVTSDLEAVTL